MDDLGLGLVHQVEVGDDVITVVIFFQICSDAGALGCSEGIGDIPTEHRAAVLKFDAKLMTNGFCTIDFVDCVLPSESFVGYS